jgi:hypothetical protein
VNCLIKTTSLGPNNVTVAVAVDRSEGSTSLTNGQLELMVHRRMMHDDGRGVGQNLNEPGLDGSGLIDRNDEHPSVYRHVDQPLQQQNFLVIRGDLTCPTKAAATIDPKAAVTAVVATAAHQP